MKVYPQLETGRLMLIKPVPGNAGDLFRIRSNEAVNQFIDRPLSKSPDDCRDFIVRVLEGIEAGQSFYWLIFLKETNEFIGTACIWNIDHNLQCAETGFELLPQFQGRGYMSEVLGEVVDFAFTALPLKRLEAYTHQGNARSIRLLERNGFRKEPADPGHPVLEFRFTREKDREP